MIVHYHETRDVLDDVPPLLRRFALRALLSARPGEKVLLPDAPWPTELSLMNRLGFGPKPEDVVCTPSNDLLSTKHDGFHDATLYIMSGISRIARRIAKTQGMLLQSPKRSVCLVTNLKSTFQRLINEVGWRPSGVICRREKIAPAMAKLFEQHEKLIIKGDLAASGLEQVVLSRDDEIPDCSQFSRESKLVVIQEWVPHSRSVSLHYDINQTGGVKQISLAEQRLSGTHHIGNVFPVEDVPAKILEKIFARGDYLATRFSAMGYWRYLGLDFIIGDDNEPWPVEANARIYAPWYPWEASRRKIGRPVPFEVRSLRIRKNIPFEEIEVTLRPVLFDAKNNRGVVPFCFVPEHGFIYLAIYAATRAELMLVLKRVDDQTSAIIV